MTDTISQLVHLSRSMQSLASASALLAGVPESMRALHDEFTAAKAELDALDASATQAALDRRQAESAIAEAQEKLKHFQQQVSKVRNQREYGALLTEIDTVKQQSKTLEDAALAALRALRGDCPTAAERRAASLISMRATRPSWSTGRPKSPSSPSAPRSSRPKWRRSRSDCRGRSSAICGASSSATRATRWRSCARSSGRARRRSGICSSCNYQIRPQVAVEIRSRGTIVQSTA